MRGTWGERNGIPRRQKAARRSLRRTGMEGLRAGHRRYRLLLNTATDVRTRNTEATTMPAPIHAGDPEIPPTSPPEAPPAEVPLGVPPGGPAEVPEPPAEVPPGAPPEVPPPPQERALAVPAAAG